MPLPGGGRYRVTTTASGTKIRLHITQGGAVNEAKNLRTGAVHTASEFSQARTKSRLKRRMV